MQPLFIQTEAMLYEFRKNIPTNCKTAKSIDRNDPWHRVAVFAKDDGFLEIADQLEKSKTQLVAQSH
jgi:hypothetical protein